MNTRLSKEDTIRYLRNVGIMEDSVTDIKSKILSINEQVQAMGMRTPYEPQVFGDSGVNVFSTIKNTILSFFISLLVVFIITVLAFVGEVISWAMDWFLLRDIAYKILAVTSALPRALVSSPPFEGLETVSEVVFDVLYSTVGVTLYILLILVLIDVTKYTVYRLRLKKDQEREAEHDAREDARLLEEKAIKRELLIQKDHLFAELDKARVVLDAIYGLEHLQPKYRQLGAVCAIYNYMSIGKVETLSSAMDQYDLNDQSEDNLPFIVKKMKESLAGELDADAPLEKPQSLHNVDDCSALVSYYLHHIKSELPQPDMESEEDNRPEISDITDDADLEDALLPEDSQPEATGENGNDDEAAGPEPEPAAEEAPEPEKSEQPEDIAN